MSRCGCVWQATYSICEDRYLLVFTCGGVAGSGRLQILCVRTGTYWYLDVEVWLGLAGYRLYVWGQALTGIYMWRFG